MSNPSTAESLNEYAESPWTENLQSIMPAASRAHSRQNRGQAQSDSFANFLRRNFFELTRLKFALLSFVVNTLRRRYHNSVLGFAWSLLNPLMTMGVMALIFSLIFHQDPKKFTIYLFGAMLPWSYIVEAAVSGSTSLIAYESFLKKLYLPKTFFPLVVVSISSANFLFSMVSLLLLGFCFGMQASLSLLWLPAATAVLFLFNFGLALTLAVATPYFRDLTHIVSVILGATFYTMPIIYPVEQMPVEYHGLFMYNPFYYFLCLFRAIMYETRTPTLSEWLTPLAIAFAAIAAATFLLRMKEKDIIYRL